jgi:hypothetical protein
MGWKLGQAIRSPVQGPITWEFFYFTINSGDRPSPVDFLLLNRNRIHFSPVLVSLSRVYRITADEDAPEEK